MSETNYLTTKEVARLCRVSDATVKRWEDAGLLKSERTSGKHRRFRAEEVARFQREQGLGQKVCHGDQSVASSVSRRKNLACSNTTLFDLLVSGCEEETANFMIGSFLQGAELTEIFDELLSPALRRIGEQWYEGELSVAQEHLASRAAHYAVHKLRTSLPLPEMKGKTAFCAAMEGDLHELPAYLAQVTIENEGWEVMNFGANTPLFFAQRGSSRIPAASRLSFGCIYAGSRTRRARLPRASRNGCQAENSRDFRRQNV